MSHADCRLRDDRPRIHFRHHKMDRCAVDGHTRLECSPMRIKALESRQQGRVDIEYPMLPLLDEARSQQAHETGKTDYVDAIFLSGGLHCRSKAGRALA